MIRALIRKEWLKLRWAVLGLGIFAATLMAFMVHAQYTQFAAYPGMSIWQNVIERHTLYFSRFQNFGLLTGIVVGLVQFLPDIPKRGLRLLFHLPVPHMLGMGITVACGAVVVAGLGIFCMVGILLTGIHYYPAPIVEMAWETALPWFFAAIPAYAMTSAALIEIHRVRKVAYAVIGWQVSSLFFGGCGFSNFAPVLGIYFLLAICFLVAPFLPAERFKKGAA